MTPSHDISRLLEIMMALRTPETGCPWDLEQNFSTIAPYTLEEAYEVVDAIERGDLTDLRDELGDLLLQVVFHARMAEEVGAFAFGDVVEAITAKMIRRHPHVFGDAGNRSSSDVKEVWDQIKAEEKEKRRQEREIAGMPPEDTGGLLTGIPVNMTSLTRAVKLQRKAATVGFDWTDTADVISKIREEIEEIEQALVSGKKADIEEEIGDLIFAVANLARHANVDPETATRATNAKFERRFRYIEQNVARLRKTMSEASLKDMENLWQEAKQQEKAVDSVLF